MANTRTTPYPKIDALPTSDRFRVFANDYEIWTEKLLSSLDFETLPNWFSAPQVRSPQELHIASFEGEGPQDFRVELPEKVDHATLRPLSRNLAPEIKDGAISFTLEQPDQVVLEIPGMAPLMIFYNPAESTPISADDPAVHYFGPGEHRVGEIELNDGQTAYLAAGSIVYGNILAKKASDVSVKGRGILVSDTELASVLFDRCQKVHVEGITVRRNGGWTNRVLDSQDVVYENVKVITFGPSGDGISPLGTRDMRISNCFLRCTDDCVAIKTPEPHLDLKGLLVEKTTMLGFAYADGVTIGFETKGAYIEDVTIRDCDVLKSCGGSRVDGHSAFSIICDGDAEIRNILYEDIRVEQADEKLFELHVTVGNLYRDGSPGRIRKVTLRNICWHHAGPIVIQGHDSGHTVEEVLFEDCKIAGEPLTSLDHASFQVGPHTSGVTLVASPMRPT